MLRALLHFDSYVTIVLEILRQPDGREVTPSELLDDNIAIEENLTDVHWMVPANLVVGHALILTRVLVIKEVVFNLVLEWREI